MSRSSDVLLEAIQNVQAKFVEDAPVEVVFDNLLEHLLQLTDSEYGFIGEIHYKDGEPFLRTQSITNIAWNDETRAFYEDNVASGLEFFNLDTLFGAVMRTGKVVMSNDPANDPRSGGRPPQHPALKAFLGLPLLHRERMVGMVGIANRPNGYDEEFVETLRPFMTTCAGLIEAFRSSRRRLEAEAALRESELRFRQLAESIHQVFWLTDVVEWAVIYVSPAYERIWGRDSEGLYEDPGAWIEGIHPDDRAAVGAAFASVGETLTYDEEYRVVRPDGTERWIHDHGFPIHDETGKLVRMAGIAEDITDRKRMEESLRKSEERLRHSQKIEALGRVAGGVAHDFNNLLTVINGNTDSLLRNVDHDTHRHLLRQIEQAGQRAVGLTRQLLAFSRKQVLALRVLDVRDLVVDLHKLLPPLLGELVELQVDTGTEPQLVRADMDQLVQVVMNLAVNARDAMLEGGELHIKTAAVPTTENGVEAPGLVELIVSDTGVGITDDVLPYIFDPFYTTKAEGQGSGLGLSTAYGIITQLGGTVEVDTEPGRGTTFHIRLPAVYADKADVQPARAPRARRSRNLSILLVEDELLVRSFIAVTLQDEGHSVTEAEHPAAALEIVNSTQPSIDLLVTDVVLPGSSGVELAEQLRAIYPSLAVLYISGYTADYAAEIGVAEGGKNFLQKPFAAETLIESIDDLLGAEAD